MSPGVFSLSLDTELGWGSFDKGDLDTYRRSYLRTPEIVTDLCRLFDEYDVSATWAVVAHLLKECDGTHGQRSGTGGRSSGGTRSPSRRAWLAEAPCVTERDRRLWHAPEILESITACETDQDVGLHGYSHLVFSNHDETAAREELTAAVETLRECGVDPRSFVYPRNEVAHTEVLADHGIDVYRGVDARWYERRPLSVGRGPLRFFEELAVVTPPTAVPFERDGAVCIPGSQMFRPDEGLWATTPDRARVERAKKGLDRAADRGEVFHLWFHPFNLGRDPERLLTALEEILDHARRLRRAGRLEVCSMQRVGELFRAGRWTDSTPRHAEAGR